MIYLAFRYLVQRRRQTLLTLLGVFFGTTAYIAVSGFFRGFQGYMIHQLVNNSAQVHIQSRQSYIATHDLDRAFYGPGLNDVFWALPPSGTKIYLSVQNPRDWYRRLQMDPRVEAYSPNYSAPALFTVAGVSVSTTLTGCDPLQQAHVTTVGEYMVEGQFADIANGGNQLVLGDELMRRLGAGLERIVMVSVGTGLAQPFKVVGRFLTGNRFVDLQAYGAIRDVQNLNSQPNVVNEIAVRLKDYRMAASLATTWSAFGPERVESWDQQNASILSVFKLQDALRFTMIACILIVAGFGIYNVLNMTVNQKRRDIAILRSMGYDTFDIVSLFFSQGLIVGIVGGFFGVIAGYLVCRYLQTIQFTSGAGAGHRTYLHISLDWHIYLQAAALALISSSVASVLPARAAGRLTPIEIIRTSGG